ncbi:MAG: tetratricopeptide repeat protein [Acidobacteria bacterium]|nr:tetratricopeptide repeat protein [Acidobacteriota bacterium]
MRTVFLFVLLSWVTGNPILAGAIILLILGGSYFLYSRRLYRFRQIWRDRARIRRLQAELAVNPENAKARSDLGSILVRKGRFAEALGHLERAIPRCDEVPDTNFYLGWTYLVVGDLEQGRRHIMRALELNPRFGYGEPHLRLGDFFFGRGEHKEATPHYEAFRGIHSSGVEGLYKLGECYLAIGERQQGIEVLHEAVAAYRTAPWYRRQEERRWGRKARRALRKVDGIWLQGGRAS